MQYLIITLFLFLSMLFYFKIADRFSIIDKPNERSSHQYLTIRGGGIIFLLAIVICGCIYPGYVTVILGAFIIGAISFLDDRITLSSRLRMLFHLISVTLLLVFLDIFTSWPWYILPLLYVFVIGIINAYNFMDGINGITGLYSLSVLSGLQYVNLQEKSFVEPDMIWIPMLSCVVFLFFNFRKRAKCFAGDVGSVTMAFWIVFLLLKLILESDDYKYILFLAVYGVDSILTIIHRLILRQNIFDAHRLHFYQILANEKGIPHRQVSIFYAIVQALIISLVLISPWNFFMAAAVTLVPLIVIYVVLKPRLMVA